MLKKTLATANGAKKVVRCGAELWTDFPSAVSMRLATWPSCMGVFLGDASLLFLIDVGAYMRRQTR